MWHAKFHFIWLTFAIDLAGSTATVGEKGAVSSSAIQWIARTGESDGQLETKAGAAISCATRRCVEFFTCDKQAASPTFCTVELALYPKKDCFKIWMIESSGFVEHTRHLWQCSCRKGQIRNMTDRLAMRFLLLRILSNWATVAASATRQRNFEEYSQLVLDELKMMASSLTERALLREDATCAWSLTSS